MLIVQDIFRNMSLENPLCPLAVSRDHISARSSNQSVFKAKWTKNLSQNMSSLVRLGIEPVTS